MNNIFDNIASTLNNICSGLIIMLDIHLVIQLIIPNLLLMLKIQTYSAMFIVLVNMVFYSVVIIASVLSVVKYKKSTMLSSIYSKELKSNEFIKPMLITGALLFLTTLFGLFKIKMVTIDMAKITLASFILTETDKIYIMNSITVFIMTAISVVLIKIFNRIHCISDKVTK